MKITASLETINSKRDRAGNCYFAFIYTDNATGKTARGTISGGASNVRQIVFVLNGGTWTGSEQTYQTARELPIREFERLTKSWQYAGCTSEELAAFVRKELAA